MKSEYLAVSLFLLLVFVVSMSGCVSDTGPGGALTVSELLENPVYDLEIKIYGEVNALGELNYPCFELISGGRKIRVCYDLMIDDDGAEKDPINLEGIKNGDKVILTGELKTGGTYRLLNDFWISGIELHKERGTKIPNPASKYCEKQKGKILLIDTGEGQIGYCVLPDDRICEEWKFFNSEGKICMPLEEELIFSSLEDCKSECTKAGYGKAECKWPTEANASDVNTGICLIQHDVHCGNPGQCSCYCYSI